MKWGTMAVQSTSSVTKCLVWVTALCLATVTLTTEGAGLYDLRFTQNVYNVLVPENSHGKTFAIPTSKMGIFIPENLPVTITYQLLDTTEDLFKVEDRLVGDFSFLLIRTHSGSYGKLNREFKSEYHFKVKAVAESNGVTFETTTNVIVYISDLNDLQPLFDQTSYEVSVPEDTQLHQSIAQVSAYDGDQGINREIYYSFVDKTNVFAIHPTSGVVTLTRPLNYFLKKEYTLQILAQDRGPTSTQSTRKRPSTLLVQVRPVNYFPPDINVKKLPTVIEPSQGEVVLAIVKVLDRDIGENGKVKTVQLVQSSAKELISLQKGGQEGEYRVVLRPSAQVETPNRGFNLTVQAIDNGAPALDRNETFYISVYDSNVIPKFTVSAISVHVEEIAPINTPITYVQAESNRKFDIRYEIVGGNTFNLFKVNHISGLVSTSAILDAEKLRNLQLKIVVYNAVQRNLRSSDTCIVNITIVDNNDNAPQFHITDNVSEIYIQENLPIGSSIFKIGATDLDQNENGKISFSIINAKNVPFEIEPFTGIIRTSSILDYETMRHSYKLNIRISDWGLPFSRENEMIFTVNLQDTNDNKPQFETGNCTGVIHRKTPVGTEVQVVPAIDFDVNDILQYHIEAGNENTCFAINNGTARLTLNCPLGVIKETSQRLRIVAKDGLHDSDPVDIQINITDDPADQRLSGKHVNIVCQRTDIYQRLQNLVALSHTNNEPTDFGIAKTTLPDAVNTAPKFNNSVPKNLDLSEGVAVDSMVARFQAVDQDAGYNGKLVYVIRSGDVEGYFKIDMFTGTLKVMSPLDREFRDEYRLLLEVSDLGSPQLLSNISVDIKVLDENDNAPKFNQDLYTVTISESINVNSTVAQVSATDKDLGKNAEIVYTIVSNTDHFSINPSNGIIKVNKPLDREKYPVYQVLVRASDRGEKLVSLSSTATVLVELTDVNDVVPEFTPNSYSVRIREDHPVGSVVTVVTAADTDEGKFGEVSYHLVYGEDFFEIDSETGVIRIIKGLDYESHQVHNISVRAQDGGIPPLVSVCFINIEVSDVNENFLAPVFESFFAIGYVSENEPIGVTVMFVKAYDPDGDGVTYSIRDGSGLGRFTIDSNGTICTSQVLDRETATHYWLTVYAQDHGLVPLHSRLEVYIEVTDVNDHIPLTFEPVYYGTVVENANNGFVTQIQAFDLDRNLNQSLKYTITRFDPLEFFQIDPETGVIRASGKPFDRETRAVHQLEVTVTDQGEPPLKYETRVFVTVEDNNDNKPTFNQRLYRLQVPETLHHGNDIVVFQILAWDDDEGLNGEIEFEIRRAKDDSDIFTIDSESGVIYATDDLTFGDVHHFVVRASDKSPSEPKRSTVKVRIEVVEQLKKSPNPPKFLVPYLMKRVMENDRVGHLIDLIQAQDLDRDELFYSIVDGDPDHQFYIGKTEGILMVARPLDWENKKAYNLTLQVTDGVHNDNCTVHIEVLDVNDNTPQFSALHYEGSFPESTEVGATLLKVVATDADNNRLIYSLPECCNSKTSLQLFAVGAETGAVVVRNPLDREVAMQHNLTVMVNDQGMNPNQNFTRVTINVVDHNDHAPQFLTGLFRGRVFETAAIGTSVIQVLAIDQDKGHNAEVTYSIVSGNVGGTFDIDPLLGTVTVAKELKNMEKSEFTLVVMATDQGDTPLSTTATVSIMVTMSDNAPPRFDKQEYMTELLENQPVFTNVFTMMADCRSSVIYTIIAGNEKGVFAINPNSGVVFTKKIVDYEMDRGFNLTIRGTSVIHSYAVAYLFVHIIDANDNAPEFVHTEYVGNITEGAKVGSVVLDGKAEPLVVKAKDKDSSLNAILMYEIRDDFAKKFITIDPNTGALRTAAEIDHEVISKIEMTVEVWDMGKPQLRSRSPAKVTVYINDVNDTPPQFSAQSYKAEVLLPTYKDVIVTQAVATDEDTGINLKLQYSIVKGNSEKHFRISKFSGAVYIDNEVDIGDAYTLTIEVYDGVFRSRALLNVSITKPVQRPFHFTQEVYVASVHENSPLEETLTVVQVADRALNQQYTFSLLNGQGKFEMGRTSGVLTTTGVSFDREEINMYNLVVEVRRESTSGTERAHMVIMVTVEDENDNNPMFTNQPYHAVLVHTSPLGHVIKQVTAIDHDANKFGRVTFSWKGQGDIDSRFAIDPDSGKITLFKPLRETDVGQRITLAVTARDGGLPARTAETSVQVSIISDIFPVFEHTVYRASIPEYFPIGSSVASLSANSPSGQKLIYTISDGDTYGDFNVDYNIGVVKVQGEVTMSTSSYNLTVQAIEVMSGLTATAMLMVTVQDVNNISPSFSEHLYKVGVSESARIGALVTTVTAFDPEPKNNGLIHYTLLPQGSGNALDYFSIDPETGRIFSKRFLDREQQSEYQLLVEAADSGVPALSGTTAVVVKIDDLNDNPPVFDQPFYHCMITDQVTRGQLVTKVSATDPDSCSIGALRYAIIAGNDDQTFEMDEVKGIILLSLHRVPKLHLAYNLNISVSDGVFSTFARVNIKVQNSNKHAPRFDRQMYVAEFPENYGEGMLVTQVKATDEDDGTYGMITYSIPSEEMQQYFRMDADTGEMYSMQVLDREQRSVYSVPVAVTDNGGRMTFTTVHISVSDQNDNVPLFLAQEYKVTTLEGLPLNYTVLQILAEDPDIDRNGAIEYSFSPGTSKRVTQTFRLDPNSGTITLAASLKDSVNEYFQFFIQASDKGLTPMKNDVPVNIWVTNNDSAQPVFSQPAYSFFMLENEPVSAVVATVRALSSSPLEYIIVPGYTKGSNSPARFSIDSQGRIHVTSSVDMETISVYTLTVQAQTLSNPPLVTQAIVYIRLMDINDNYPYFESFPYTVTLPENTDAGTELMQVVARDLDRSSKFVYSFGDDVRKYSQKFSIDSSTGMISLLSPLDREAQDLYNLTVWVKDNEGPRALQNFTVVQVKVMDHNDNPPEFTRTLYQAAVNEDAFEGTILMTLTTVDKDLTSDPQYYITEGDPEGKFKIHKNGDVYVNRVLDREQAPRYKLTVAVTDGAFVTTATLTIDILDANDNAPVCSKPVYTAVVSEDVTPSWVIASLKATDADEYGSLRYELTGDGAKDFYMEPNSGILTAAVSLDRERVDRYYMEVRAVDIGGKFCVMEVHLMIRDVNDNSPVFETLEQPVSISEGAPVNTLVYRVSASDADLGNYRQIVYSLISNPGETFKMDSKSGLIQLSKPLDRERMPGYTLRVRATDKGTPQLTSEMDIDITVTDINDNPPEFEQTTYWSSVPEDAVIGQYVTTVRATSRDIGLNAKIAYFIQAGNDKDKFTVEPDTGVIRTAGYLDHESVPGYVLTIRAQDHGDIPLSNTAYVQINVTDVNDNAPVFMQKHYTGQVREDAAIGTRVLQLSTADLDSDPANKVVNYSIIAGDSLHMFDVHRTEGYLIVRNRLDREDVDMYTLQVRATNYHMSTDTLVTMVILDANDCAPTFSQENYTLLVQMNDVPEDRKLTTCILKFEVTDDDLDPNGAPFTFDLIGHKDEKFKVDAEGNLCIAGELNRKITAIYHLKVRVFDRGTPAMFSDVNVDVEVIEESTQAPVVSNLDVSISSYLDEFPGGVIGTLKAVDGDKFDTLSYTVSSVHRNMFDIDKKDGRVIAFAGLDSGRYSVNVSVTDGKYTTFGIVNVDVTTITEQMIENAVTIQFDNMEPREFVKIHKADFIRVVKDDLNVRITDVMIISIQNSQSSINKSARKRRNTGDKNLDVLFAVYKGSEYLPRDRLKRKVMKMEDEIETTLGVKVVSVFSDTCSKDLCKDGECVGLVEFDKDSLVPVFLDGGSFVSAKHKYTYECQCPNGNVGDNCLPNPRSCSEAPCPEYKVCVPDVERGYQCMCPPGQTGRHCEKDLDNKCDNINCNKGDSPITFTGSSYAKWTLHNKIEERLSLSLRIKTIKETSCLMFAKGRVDYSILELKNGMVQYRFDCGSGEGLVLLPNHISDGKWHTIMVERYGNSAEVFLDGQYSAITTAPGKNDVLNLDNSDVYFGAEVETYSNGYIDVRKGFRGCIEDIRIHNVRLPVSGSNAVALSQQFEQVEFSCRDSEFALLGDNVCSSFPCMNGGKCESAGTSYICRCGDRFSGQRCEIDKEPCLKMPCLNNGVCQNLKGVPNDFICTCQPGYLGRRCEYGKYCRSLPCLHGGTCIEGPTSYTCRCLPGYSGPRCETLQDVCLSNPCENDGICLQEGTLYTCNCTLSYQGDKCQDVVLPVVTSNAAGIMSDEIYIIVGVICGLIIIVLILVFARVMWQRRKRRHRQNSTGGVAHDTPDVYLNLLKDDKHKYKAENLVENVNNRRKTPPSPMPPPVPNRPASYTPSARDSIHTLNNFDQLRNCNYGSAADDLENPRNIPPYNVDFQTFGPVRSVASVQPTLPAPLSASDSDSVQKEPWERACQNILQNYMSVAEKNSDKMLKKMPVGTVQPMNHLQGHVHDNTSVSSLPISESEDDQQESAKNGYHWDTSDWAPEKSLPNISELPAGECPDSPGSGSPHSNESNTNVYVARNSGHYMTDGEFIESEYVGDSEFAETDTENIPDIDLPNYEELLAEQSRLLEGYESRNINVHIHPNYYLPLNSSFTSTHSAEEGPRQEIWPPPPAYAVNGLDGTASDSSHTTSSEDDNDSVLHYGFPVNQNNINRLSMITTDSEFDHCRLSAAFTTDSDLNDGDYNHGEVVDDMSEISGLCELEDSEANISDDENTPLQTDKQITEV
ncbi:protocadherin Fat 1-like isoform X4 [Dreissena polymorpha]|uniref:protocadherin Fat 1-like isoform X4 n=1 Tax=Dreissena polymorpha TaxID=45954 RepID=UPI0022656035|nr:protocadherin Fat 1-like isoform X4 [Dreissena polymorpha]